MYIQCKNFQVKQIFVSNDVQYYWWWSTRKRRIYSGNDRMLQGNDVTHQLSKTYVDVVMRFLEIEQWNGIPKNIT